MSAPDVFLSYNSADYETVRRVRDRLHARRVTTFHDRSNLAPGLPWVPELQRQIRAAGAVAVFLGPNGMGNWQQREVHLAMLRQDVEPTFPLIPILLPGLKSPPLDFLRLNMWIDLRDGIDSDDPLDRLANAIQRQAPAGRPDICPYRGLEPFREEDASFFFGRSVSIADLAQRVGQHGVVAVVGRSGSGKSSLVYAGLIPGLRRRADGRTWDVASLRPGVEPLHALARAFAPPPRDLDAISARKRLNAGAAALRDGTVTIAQLARDRLAGENGTDRLLLYVDQWEELYTQAVRRGTKEEMQQASRDVECFIDQLLHATGDSPVSLVLTVRADFYDRLLKHGRLATTIQSQQVNLGPMSRDDLRACIERPAQAVGLDIPHTLVDAMLEEVEQDEGKLPLLEYALKGTWENRDGNRLTHDGYKRAGGVGGAIGTRAQALFEALKANGDTGDEQAAARRLFVSMVTLGEGREDTRARIGLPDDAAVRAVVDRFADQDARLVVTGRDLVSQRPTVEIAHEALIRSWPALGEWIGTNREALRIRGNVRDFLLQWQERKDKDQVEDDSLLLPQGRYLEEAKYLLGRHGDVLIDDVRPYIERSIEAERRELARDQEEAREKLEAAERAAAAERRTVRLTRVGLGIVGTLAACLLGLAAYASWQEVETKSKNEQLAHALTKLAQATLEAHAKAEAAERATAAARTEKARVVSREALTHLASGNVARARNLLLREIEAHATSPAPYAMPNELAAALASSIYAEGSELRVPFAQDGHPLAFFDAADTRMVVVRNARSDASLEVWSIGSGERTRAATYPGFRVLASTVLASRIGLVASLNSTSTVYLHDLGSPHAVLDDQQAAMDATLFADGRRIAVLYSNKLEVWETGDVPRRLASTSLDGLVQSIMVADWYWRVVVDNDAGHVVLHDGATVHAFAANDLAHKLTKTLSGLPSGDDLTLSDDGRTAISCCSQGVRVLDLFSGASRPLAGSQWRTPSAKFLRSRAVTRGGRWLLLTGDHAPSHIEIWDISVTPPRQGSANRMMLGVSSRLSASGKYLLSESAGTHLHRLDRSELAERNAVPAEASRWNANGILNSRSRLFLDIYSTPNGRLQEIWARSWVPAGRQTELKLDRTEIASSRRGALNPDGTMAALLTEYGGTVRVWSTQSGELRAKRPLAECGEGSALGWMPSGSHVVVGTWTGTVCVMDAGSGEMKVSRDAVPNDGITAIQALADGTIVVALRSGRLGVLDARDPGTIKLARHLPLPADSFVETLTTRSDGMQVAAGTRHGRIHLFSTTDWRRLDDLDTDTGDTISAVAISDDGRYIAAGTINGSIWKSTRGSSSADFRVEDRLLPIVDLVFDSERNELVASYQNGAVIIRSIDQKVILETARQLARWPRQQ